VAGVNIYDIATIPDHLREFFTDAPQMGLEPTPDEYVAQMVGVFREVRRVLKDDGTLWLNIGDSYGGATTIGRNDAGRDIGGRGGNRAGSGNPGRQGSRVVSCKPKDLVGIPWRVAFALQADGWWLRSDIIWAKPNPMPESVTDRPTKAHEYVFLLAKSERYFYDAGAIADRVRWKGGGFVGGSSRAAAMGRKPSGNEMPGAQPVAGELRNARTVWTIPSEPYGGAHFAVMPSALVSRCIMAGSRIGDAVLDPFFGSGTVGQVAESLGRKWFGCELNPAYAALIKERTAQTGLFAHGGTET
jgi:DNA modification methylase